jgi:hypothetical protein
VRGVQHRRVAAAGPEAIAERQHHEDAGEHDQPAHEGTTVGRLDGAIDDDADRDGHQGLARLVAHQQQRRQHQLLAPAVAAQHGALDVSSRDRRQLSGGALAPLEDVRHTSHAMTASRRDPANLCR